MTAKYKIMQGCCFFSRDATALFNYKLFSALLQAGLPSSFLFFVLCRQAARTIHSAVLAQIPHLAEQHHHNPAVRLLTQFRKQTKKEKKKSLESIPAV